MSTLLLAADPATGSTRLTITPTSDITAIRRSDANGSYPVRTLTGQLPHVVADGVLVLDDYEANGTATYTVTTTAETLTGTIVLNLPTPWLSTPEMPQHSTPVVSVLDYGAGVSTRSTVFEPDGRQEPIVIVMGGSTRRGTMTVQGGTYPQALGILRICQRGQSMMLRQTHHAGMDMFFLPMQADIVTSLKAGTSSEFDVQVQYLEVGRPTGALAGALGWDWDELAVDYSSWDDVFDGYNTWGDVLIDRRTP